MNAPGPKGQKRLADEQDGFVPGVRCTPRSSVNLVAWPRITLRAVARYRNGPRDLLDRPVLLAIGAAGPRLSSPQHPCGPIGANPKTQEFFPGSSMSRGIRTDILTSAQL